MAIEPALPCDDAVKPLAVDPVVVPDPTRFDLAIALNGTVSAGAWTAGVLDFLVEALDCWQVARESAGRDDPVARHRVNLVLAAGASGGGVCAAILARLVGCEFPHVNHATPLAEAARNPFYDTWVNRLAIEDFATIDDLARGAPLRSVLNARAIDHAGEVIVRHAGVPLGTGASPVRRDWVNDPFRVIFTLCNLRGIPYRIDFANRAAGAQHFLDHADWVSFRRHLSSAPTRTPHEFALVDVATNPDEADWARMAEFAKATAAFPLGFAARRLSRPVGHYLHRAVAVPAEGGGRDWRLLVPALDRLAPALVEGEYAFTAVDGGTLNNSPVELARTRLAGLTGRNPRDPKSAHAGVLLIDPFAEAPGLAEPADPLHPARVLAGTLGTLVGQARRATSDLLLAVADDVCSRFMIAPMAAGVRGGAAIVGSRLGAFLGFFHADFRRHDYLLGRANAQHYLLEELALHPDNPVFAVDRAGPAAARDGFEDTGKRWRRLIPLHGSAAAPQIVPPWPAGTFARERARLAGLLGTRLDAVVDRATDELGIEGWLIRRLIETRGDAAIARRAADHALAAVDAAVAAARL